MPTHAGELREPLHKALKALAPRRVIDIGVGNGVVGQDIRDMYPKAYLIGIEIWEPYDMIFGLSAIYDELHIADCRDYPFETGKGADLVLLGDVLEHMPKKDGLELLRRCAVAARHVLITTPKGFMPQGSYGGNPWEEHVCGYFPRELLAALRSAGFPYTHGQKELSITFITIGCRSPTCELPRDIFEE